MLVLLPNLGGSCPYVSGPPNQVRLMAQHRSNARNRRAKLDHHIVPFPTRNAPPEFEQMTAPSSSSQATGPQVRVNRRAAAQVVVLEVAGRLGDVVDELDRAIQLALAGGPRGVVCDLTKTVPGAERVAVEVVATAGRHVQDWPGIPVAVACPDPVARRALRAHPLGGHLIVTELLAPAIAAVLETPYLMVRSLRLAAHPTAPRACREFLTRTLGTGD
jgi:hypothetical protein